MKLALYLPNFRDKVTVKELEDLTALAEELDFDSVWTLDRIVVPEASDRARAAVPVRDDDGVPERHAGHLAGRVVPGHDADPLAGREDDEGPDRHEHHRHAVPLARRARRRARHPGPPVGRPAQRRRRLRLDARGVRRRQRHAPLPAPARPRARDDRDHAGHLDQRPVRVPRRVRRLRPLCGFGHKPIQKPRPADLLLRPEGPEAFGQAHREVRPVGLDRHPGLARRTSSAGRARWSAS